MFSNIVPPMEPASQTFMLCHNKLGVVNSTQRKRCEVPCQCSSGQLNAVRSPATAPLFKSMLWGPLPLLLCSNQCCEVPCYCSSGQINAVRSPATASLVNSSLLSNFLTHQTPHSFILCLKRSLMGVSWDMALDALAFQERNARQQQSQRWVFRRRDFSTSALISNAEMIVGERD
jgi:hypothetical protein